MGRVVCGILQVVDSNGCSIGPRRLACWQLLALVVSVLLLVAGVRVAAGAVQAMPQPRGKVVARSDVAIKGGVRWRAVELLATPIGVGAGTICVYRWQAGRWRLVGAVSTAGTPGGAGTLAAAELTGGGAPDFVFADANGADWIATIVVADLGGRWRSVPFEAGRSFSTVIDARGVRGRLVLGEADACGCAAGPETFMWYRFDGTRFVPTTPPGAAPQCAPVAAAAAKPLPGGLRGLFPWTPAQLAAPITVRHVECEDGWALADVTSSGRPLSALFEQSGDRWQRAAIGEAQQLKANVNGFALPLLLFDHLAHRLHSLPALCCFARRAAARPWSGPRGCDTLAIRTADPFGPARMTGVRSAQDVKALLLSNVASVVERPGMYGGPETVSGDLAALIGYLCFIDERTEEWASPHRRFGAYGVPTLDQWFDDGGRRSSEAASLYAEIAHDLGYLEIDHRLDAEEWSALQLTDLDQYRCRDWKMSEITGALPAPSKIVGRSVLCYAPPAGSGGWAFFDFLTFPIQQTDPLLRDVRLPTEKAIDGLVLTPAGSTIATEGLIAYFASREQERAQAS